MKQHHKKNKKALTTQTIIELALLLVTLVLLLVYFSHLLNQGSYESSIFSCTAFVKGISGNSNFFQNGISDNLIKSISNLCPAKKVTISNSDISPAGKLIDSCWKEFGSGIDFFPAGNTASNTGLCVFCGNIQTQNNIQNFNLKLYSLLNKNYTDLYTTSSGINNENKLFLYQDAIPSQLDSANQNLGVYYLIYKPEISFFTSVSNSMTTFFTGLIPNSPVTNALKNIINKNTLSSSNSIGGIFLALNEKQKDGTYKMNSIPKYCTNIIYPSKIY